MENEIEDVNLPNDNESTDDVEALKQRNQELYEQLKKAKGFIRGEDGKWVKKEDPKPEIKPEVKPEAPVKESAVSIQDIHALRNVHDDDIAEVQEYANFKKISIREALNSGVVKTLLAEKEEQRKVADATNTKSKRQGANAPSDDEILSKARVGELADPEKMAEIRQKKRLERIAK